MWQTDIHPSDWIFICEPVPQFLVFLRNDGLMEKVFPRFFTQLPSLKSFLNSLSTLPSYLSGLTLYFENA